MSTREPGLQDLFLNQLRRDRVPVALFLVKGVKLHGIVTGFDAFSIQLRREGAAQLVYKHAIATIAPQSPLDSWDSALSAPADPRGLQDEFLAAAAAGEGGLDLFLINGVHLSGDVSGFDQFSLLLARQERIQLVYKHAISTLQPREGVRRPSSRVVEATN